MQSVQPYATCTATSALYTHLINDICGNGINGVSALYTVYIITAGMLALALFCALYLYDVFDDVHYDDGGVAYHDYNNDGVASALYESNNSYDKLVYAVQEEEQVAEAEVNETHVELGDIYSPHSGTVHEYTFQDEYEQQEHHA